MQIRGHEQRVVVEHLLEVRDQPFAVDGVAVEASADEVVHPAECHAVERLRHELELVAPEEELERRRGRELRCVPEAAPHRIEHAAQPTLGVDEQRRRQGVARRVGRASQPLRDRARVALDLPATLAPCIGDRHQ